MSGSSVLMHAVGRIGGDCGEHVGRGDSERGELEGGETGGEGDGGVGEAECGGDAGSDGGIGPHGSTGCMWSEGRAASAMARMPRTGPGPYL